MENEIDSSVSDVQNKESLLNDGGTLVDQQEFMKEQQLIDHFQEKLKSLKKLYYLSKVSFNIMYICTEAMPKICLLLNSKSVNDVKEAINFVTYAYKFELETSLEGIQKMLKLIFTKEVAIKDALLEAFTQIYLNCMHRDEQDFNDRLDDIRLEKSLAYLEIRQLSKMVVQLNQGERVCAEAVIRELYNRGNFTQQHIQILWEQYSLKLRELSEEDSRAALILIGMLASAQPMLIRKNLSTLISISLEKHRGNHRIVFETCIVLLKAFQLPSTDLMEKFYKLPQDHSLFEHLISVLVESIIDLDSKYWFAMSMNICKVIYFLAEQPDPLMTRLVKQCYEAMLDSAVNNDDAATHYDYLLDEGDLQSDQVDQPSRSLQSINAKIQDAVLARFITLLGDIAVNLLIHLDFHIMREIKIRDCIREKEEESKNSKSKNRSLIKSRKSLASRMSLSRSTINTEEDDEQFFGSSENKDDRHQERISQVTNKIVLFKNGILTKFKHMIDKIVIDYEGHLYSFHVRLAASLTMSKFMVLSSEYTRSNRVLLAEILERSKEGDIRSNAVVAFGDLMVRFPNEIEHYTQKIFACLNDDDYQVKKNALKVLTRLILADMVKPKGHISKIAQLITDQDQLLSSLARLFFVELARKNNAYIYNFLPDIISNLSGSSGLDEEKFQGMIKFLFELLEKTRSTESLITKLCHRFSKTSDERTWRDLSFCLANLTYNDRALNNLKNNFSCFADTLYCDVIFENISIIIQNARKGESKMTGRPEMKALLDELEKNIKQQREKQ